MNSLNFKWIQYFRIKDNKPILCLICFFLSLSGAIGYKVPQYMTELYESYGSDKFLALLRFGLFLFIAQYLVRVAFSISIGFYIKNLITILREDLFSHWIYSHDKVITKRKVYFSQEKYTRGEFQARLINDIDSIRELISFGSLGIILDFVFVGSCMASFFFLERFYGVSLIVVEVLLCFVLVWLSRYIGIYFESVKKSYGQLSRVLSSVSQGFRQLFFSRKGGYSIDLAKPEFDRFLNKQLYANIWDASYYSLAESIYPILLALVIFLFPYSEITNVAILAALIDLIQRSINPIKGIAGKLSNIQRAMAGVKRVHELDTDVNAHSFKVENLPQMSKYSSADVSVELFQYPERQGKEGFKLQEVAFSLTKGNRLGVIGQSGCGKSTLLKLLSGEIFSDAIKIKFNSKEESREYYSSDLKDLNFLRKHVSLISQDSYVFSDTLKYNITLGLDSRDFDLFWEEIKERISYVEHWGINPSDQINPQGVSLGQKQLIAALRYCYQPKPIVLFDEISSGLDGQLEKALSDFLDYIQSDVMMVIVAHRLETVVNCQQILYLSDGLQEGLDNHLNLLKMNESYKEFFTILRGI